MDVDTQDKELLSAIQRFSVVSLYYCTLVSGAVLTILFSFLNTDRYRKN